MGAAVAFMVYSSHHDPQKLDWDPPKQSRIGLGKNRHPLEPPPRSHDPPDKTFGETGRIGTIRSGAFSKLYRPFVSAQVGGALFPTSQILPCANAIRARQFRISQLLQ